MATWLPGGSSFDPSSPDLQRIVTEGISEPLLRWKGKKRLKEGETRNEVTEVKLDNERRKELGAELSVENMVFKKSVL